MRALPDSLDTKVVAEIDRRLRAVGDDGIRVLWAIESGSRAWGFPSPDSDYDCRFLYARPRDDYLSIRRQRDVIETPLDKIFDVNGWDIVKALGLLLKGNAVVVEWLRSPIVYDGDAAFRDELLAIAEQVSDPALISRHYLHVGRRQWTGAVDDVSLKKVFYALRPAAALRWLRTAGGSAVPPMRLQQLLDESGAPAEVIDEADELVQLKSVTREVGRGTFPPALAAFVAAEFQLATDRFESARPTLDPGRQRIVDDFFRRVVNA